MVINIGENFNGRKLRLQKAVTTSRFKMLQCTNIWVSLSVKDFALNIAITNKFSLHADIVFILKTEIPIQKLKIPKFDN